MITHVLPSASGDTSRMSVKRLTRASLIAREGERLPDNHAHGTTAGLRRPIQCGAHDSPNLVVEARVSALHDPDGCGFHRPVASSVASTITVPLAPRVRISGG